MSDNEWLFRLVQERNDLRDRMEKLQAFLGSDKRSQLDERDQDLLDDQYECMYTYLTILNERIGRAS